MSIQTRCAPLTAASRSIDSGTANALAHTLHALADPLRLRILSAIATDPRGESSAGDLANLAAVSQPTVSHHLKVLKDTGLLASERRGTWVWYFVVPSKQAAVTSLLDVFAPTMAPARPSPADVHPHSPRLADAHLIARLADDLAAEFPTVSPDLVTAIVRESYAGLLRSATVAGRLIALTENFARQRLADLTRAPSSGIPQVLFVCVANAGRSQLAASLVNSMSGGAVIARSAGSQPSADVHPHVRSLLADIEGESAAADRFPKPLTDDAVRAADVVITMGCGDVCPIVPGVRYEDWAVGDPALASAEGTAAIRDDIAARVRALLDSLQLDPTSRKALQ